MHPLDLNKIAVALWFCFGEFAIVGLLIADAFTLQSISAIEDPEFWAWTAVTSCGVAALAGLLVDALRVLASVVWPGKLRYRVKLKKVLTQHLT